MNTKEVPDILPEIKYIDISDEEYQKIMNLFRSEHITQKPLKSDECKAALHGEF